MRQPAERLDQHFSDEQAKPVPWADSVERLAAAQVAWIVTVRPDGRPHATPMVPVVDDGKVYFHTGGQEVKCANLRANPHVLVLAGDTTWEAGLDVAVEGTATPVTGDAALRRLADLYRERWDGRWVLDVENGAVTPPAPGSEVVVFEVTPDRAFGFAKGDPFGQTTYQY
jgi:PPOX class probable F420-dependent enzyme